ncbi:MAG: lytic transglycosylase domain-containing protein [Terriglobia bacterium]
MGRRRRRGGPKQGSLDFQSKSRRHSKRNSKFKRIKFWSAFGVLLLLGIGLGLSIRKYYSRVIDIRTARAFEISKMVLRQTSRPVEEQNRYAEAVARNCVEKGLNPAIVSAMIVVESGGNPLTVSPSGDLGLMQVNAKIHAKSFDFERKNLLNPEENIDIGTAILKLMVERYGDEKAIQAYNGLLPEKREYAPKVLATLSRSGLPAIRQTVASNPSLVVALSDWITAFRKSSGS